MAFCNNCGHELAAGAKFCSECGQPVLTASEGQRRETVYEGKLHKCPNCGELIDAFVTVCPACTYELRSIGATSSVKELAQTLEKATSIEQRVSLIRDFYIPNTKEDIHEFFILATSNIYAGISEGKAWYVKLEQVHQKAKLSFGQTAEGQYLEQLYKKARRKCWLMSVTSGIKRSKALQGLILGAVGILLIAIGYSLSEYITLPMALGIIALSGGVIRLIEGFLQSK